MGSAMQPKDRGEKIADVAYLMSFPSYRIDTVAAQWSGGANIGGRR